MVTLDCTVETQPLSTRTSAHKSVLIALTRALWLAKDKNINIYTDSNYAFVILHVCRAIYIIERGVLMTKEKNEVQKEILQHLDAVSPPLHKPFIIHYKRQQRTKTLKARENKKISQINEVCCYDSPRNWDSSCALHPGVFFWRTKLTLQVKRYSLPKNLEIVLEEKENFLMEGWPSLQCWLLYL